MDIEKEIEAIKQRNLRVESDKAWEKSLLRKLFISATTYIVALVWLIVINDTVPWLKAFVPALGYYLSNLSLPYIKKYWLIKQK